MTTSAKKDHVIQLRSTTATWFYYTLTGHWCVLEYILSALRGPKRRRALNKLQGRHIAGLLPLRCTLQTLAALQIDPNHKVCKAAANCLYRAAGSKAFRSKVHASVSLQPR